MEVIEHGERKARTQHKCSFCGGIIAKGETYFYQKITGDELYTWKSHKRCDKLTRTLDMEPSDEGLTDDDFRECVNDAWHDLKLHERVDALVYIFERRKAAKGGV